MKTKKTYTPSKIDNAEFHRIREWWNCFHATLNGLLASGAYGIECPRERREIRRKARKFANSVHGRIEPKKTQTWRLSELYDRWPAV